MMGRLHLRGSGSTELHTLVRILVSDEGSPMAARNFQFLLMSTSCVRINDEHETPRKRTQPELVSYSPSAQWACCLLARDSSGGHAATCPLLVRRRCCYSPATRSAGCCYSPVTRPAAVPLLVRTRPRGVAHAPVCYSLQGVLASGSS